MNKLQMDPPLGGGAPPHFAVKVERRARQPAPWAWAICEEGRTAPLRRSTRLYRSAEDAWTVGKAVLERLPTLTVNAAPPSLKYASAVHNDTPDDDAMAGRP